MTYEQLEACYKTVLKQRDEAEVKVKQLVDIIENDLYQTHPSGAKDIDDKLKKIGV